MLLFGRAGRVLRPAARLASTSGHGAPLARHAGEGGLLLRFGGAIDEAVNKTVLNYMAALDNAAPLVGVRDVLPAYASLLVHFDPTVVSSAEVEKWCAAAAAPLGTREAAGEPRVVSIPVHYGGEEGPDIDEAARIAGLGSADEVARVHSAGEYRVFFLGFTGGFPYLGGLDPALASVPRLATPRQQVPKGAVGIAAGQTGVYPLSTPGGWHVLGRTPLSLFDASLDPPTLLSAGDIVKFVPAAGEYVDEKAAASAEALAAAPANPWVHILSPGPMTTVQDLGRHGYARHGVSRSGAADELALRMGNVLVGNAEGAAGLEVAMGGLKLRCVEACAIALTGADCSATLQRAGQESASRLRINETVTLRPDDEVALGFAQDGARAYVCVEGGVDVPPVLGSRSTDVRAAMGGFQGRTLRAGDTMGRLADADADADAGGAKDAASPKLVRSLHDPLRSAGVGAGRAWELRVVPGPGDPAAGASAAAPINEELRALEAAELTVLPRSDRMAVMLGAAEAEGEGAAGAAGGAGGSARLVGGQQLSEACVSGTVQLPPDGNPLILLAEHQTTGGYKVPAVVIQADLWRVGQMRPGERIRFVQTTHEEAAAALRELHGHAREVEARPVDAGELDVRALAAGINQMGSRKYELDSYELEAAEASAYALRPRAGAGLRVIDLNADCGEGFDDAGLLEYVTSVNVACGAHAGTPETIAEVLAMAAERGAGIGAHVSFVDREGFGRRPLDTPPLELRDQVLWQASALDGLCRGAGARVRYIKPHGALYHAVMAGGAQGDAVYEAAQLLELPLLLMPRSPWATYGEGFAERAYDGDALRPRDQEGALIHDPLEAAQQAVDLARRPNLHSICVHGDSPDAVTIASAVRAALEREGFQLRPFL